MMRTIYGSRSSHFSEVSSTTSSTYRLITSHSSISSRRCTYSRCLDDDKDRSPKTKSRKTTRYGMQFTLSLQVMLAVLSITLLSSVESAPASLSHWSPLTPESPSLDTKQSSISVSSSFPLSTLGSSGSSGVSTFSISRASNGNSQAFQREGVGGITGSSSLLSTSVLSSPQPQPSNNTNPSLTGRSNRNRSITSTSATAFIRRKSNASNSGSSLFSSRHPMKSNQDPTAVDDTISNGEFVSKKVTVGLSCEPEETVVKFNFTHPFRGVIQAGPSNSPCKIKGDGRKHYSLGVPHTSCGTKHVPSTGSFFNTLFIRYHPSLEMDGDQLKSIVCKFGTGSFFVG